VKSGYGRNFLLPKGKATLATPENVKKFEARRAELEKIAREQFKDAESRAEALKEFKLQITAKAGTEGKLFGSIGTADIAEACTKAGHKVSRSEVRLEAIVRMRGSLARWSEPCEAAMDQHNIIVSFLEKGPNTILVAVMIACALGEVRLGQH